MVVGADSGTVTDPEDRLDAPILKTAGVVFLGAFTTLLDTTIVSVAIDTLATSFHSSLAAVQWVSTAYLLALSIAVPVTAWAITRFGGRRMWMVSVALFGGASLLCGLAWSLPALIVFRVLQGIGGGMVMPVGQTLLAQAAGPKRMGRVMSLVGIPAQLSPILGPVLGGLLVDGVGWRWLFLLNVAVCGVALALSPMALSATPGERTRRPDLLGLALLSPGLAAVVLGLTELAEPDGSLALRVVLPLAAGAVLLGAYAVHALRPHTDPAIDLRLFARRVFAAPAAVLFLFGFCYFGPMLLLPLYLQLVQGNDALDAGLLLAPQGVGALIAALVAGKLSDRFGPRPTILAGLAVLLLGTLAYTQVGPGTSEVLLAISLGVRGLGVGSAVIPIMAAVYTGLAKSEIPQATSAANIVQRIGGSFGTAVLIVVLQQGLTAAGGAPAASAAAFGTAFWWTAAFSAIALVPAFLIPRKKTEQDASESPAETPAEPSGDDEMAARR